MFHVAVNAAGCAMERWFLFWNGLSKVKTIPGLPSFVRAAPQLAVICLDLGQAALNAYGRNSNSDLVRIFFS